MDVTSLYTNIDQTEGIQCTLKYVREHQELVPTYVPNGVLRKLLELVLQHNVFDFNGTTYRQKYGTAMGTSLAPPFAILYMASLEEPFLQSRRLKPLLFKRYIDDIFMIWPHGLDELKTFVQEFNNLRPRIKLTFEAYQTAANFLDTTVYKGRRHRENGHLDIKPFFKSTNSMHYLHFTSNHFKSVFKGIVVGEATRFLRNSSDERVFQNTIYQFQQALKLRGYPDHFVSKHLENVKLGIKINGTQQQYQRKKYKTHIGTMLPSTQQEAMPNRDRKNGNPEKGPTTDIQENPLMSYTVGKTTHNILVRAALPGPARPSLDNNFTRASFHQHCTTENCHL